MNSSAKSPFFGVFLLVFCVTLVILGSVQALLGTLRWYNASEESLENLQKYPIYSASEEPKNIRVNIAPKPEKAPVYAFITPAQKTPRIIVPAEDIDIASLLGLPTQTQDIQHTTPLPFQTPVVVTHKPLDASLPEGMVTTIDDVLTGIYFRDILWKFPLTIDAYRLSPRGQMKDESITLSGRIKTLPETAKVLVHELAHMVDIYLLRKSGNNSDPSKNFYTLSWTEPTVLRSGITADAFASGYAATNQYEDFAETFTLYIFHNAAFAERAKNSPTLQKKYEFMRDSVFGEYFKNTSYEVDPLPTKLWDVTKIAIKTNALTEIFASINRILRLL